MYETHLVKKFRLNEPPAKDGRFYVIAYLSDGRKFQVKFNVERSRGNQKELITNFVGKEIGASVLNGAFLKFTNNQINGLCDVLEANGLKKPNLENFSKNIFFGIEWHDEAKSLKCEEELKEALSECKNRKEFFGIFPFDQFLRNYDRQYFNHIIVKIQGEKKPSHYAIIDGDRIFGATSWDKLEEEKYKFECFHEDFHNKLYDLVGDDEYNTIYRFLIQITTVETGKLLELMKKVYDDPKFENDKIKQVLDYRKEKIFDYCDGSCFCNVTQKRLKEYA